MTTSPTRQTKARKCQAKVPERCYFHRNAALAERYDREATRLAREGYTDDAFIAARDARKYRKLQAAIQAGDQAVIEATRQEVDNLREQAAVARERYGDFDEVQKSLTRERVAATGDVRTDEARRIPLDPRLKENTNYIPRTLKINKSEWRHVRDLAATFNVKMDYTKVGTDKDDVTVRDIKLDGKDNDVAYVLYKIQRYGVVTIPAAKGNAAAPAQSSEADTPTEHVATIPSFDDFKKMFGLGKKRS